MKFDVKKAIAAAWDLCWAANLKRRKDCLKSKYQYDLSTTYYLTASDIERTVRSFAQDQIEGKPWGSDSHPYRLIIRIPGGLNNAVRDWLLGNPKLTSHNFGRGHISGMRFRPRGEPISEVEQTTMERKVRAKGRPHVRHFNVGEHSYSSKMLCMKDRKRSMWSRGRSRVWTERDVSKVTCPRCVNLLRDIAPELKCEEVHYDD